MPVFRVLLESAKRLFVARNSWLLLIFFFVFLFRNRFRLTRNRLAKRMLLEFLRNISRGLLKERLYLIRLFFNFIFLKILALGLYKDEFLKKLLIYKDNTGFLWILFWRSVNSFLGLFVISFTKSFKLRLDGARFQRFNRLLLWYLFDEFTETFLRSKLLFTAMVLVKLAVNLVFGDMFV